MSNSTGFFKNLYVSTDLVLADTLRLSAFAAGEKYKIIFPATQPSGGLSVLGVNSVSFDTITLDWLSPSESLPFDVINCNQLNANGKDGIAITADDDVRINNGNLLVANGTTTLGYMEAEIVNARKSGGTETSGFLVSPAQVETDIGYFLPATRPSSDGQVLSSLVNGTMSWLSPSVIQPASVLLPIVDQTLNSTTPIVQYVLTASLQPNKTYQCRAYGTMLKTNSGGSFIVSHSAVGASPGVLMIPTLALPGAERNVELRDSRPRTCLDVGFIVQTQASGPFQVILNLDSDISAGGVCEVTEIYVLFTEVFV